MILVGGVILSIPPPSMRPSMPVQETGALEQSTNAWMMTVVSKYERAHPLLALSLILEMLLRNRERWQMLHHGSKRVGVIADIKDDRGDSKRHEEGKGADDFVDRFRAAPRFFGGS